MVKKSLEYQLNTSNYLNQVMVFRRGRRRRSYGARPVIQSFKQVTVDGPASRAAATNINHTIVSGVDNYTGPSAANSEVPTGAVIKYLTILTSFTNLVSVSALLHFNLQLLRSGMPGVTPGVVGGDPNRNAVIHTAMLFLGQNQNNNIRIGIKIPPIFQRVREGDLWRIVYRCDAVFASCTQAIYKFYR